MAITGKVVLPTQTIEGAISVPLVVEIYNDDLSTEGVLEGINLVSDNDNVVFGDNAIFLPATYQIVSGGTPVTSSVVNPFSPTSQIVQYFIGNISGSSLQTINYEGNIILPTASTTTENFNAQPAVGFLAYGFGSNLSTDIFDSSFSGSTPLNGNNQGNVKITTSPSKFGTSGSIQFDGTNYISWLPSGGNESLTNLSGAGNSTIEAFFWSDDNTTYQPVIAQGQSSTVWALYVSGTEVKISGSDTNFLNGGEITSSATTINTGEWNHIAAVKSGSFLSFYLNGNRLDEIALTTGYSSSFGGQSKIVLGANKEDSPAATKFSGSLTNVRISNIAQYTGSSFTTSSVPFTNPTGVNTITIASTSSFISSVRPVNPPLLPEPSQQSILGANILVSGSARVVNATTETAYITSKPVERIACQVNAPAVVYKTQFARPQEYSNFDAIVSTTIVYKDGTEILLDASNTAGIVSDFTSSDPSRVSVVQSGSFRSTTPSTTLTNSVGTIYPAQDTQLIGGAGAVSFTFPTNFSPQIEYATISNRIGPGATGSVQIGLAEFQVLGTFISPSQLSIQSGSIVDLGVYIQTDLTPQPFEANESTTGEPTWSSSNSTFVPVGISGSITGAVDTQAQVLIKGEVPNFPQLPAYATITLNKIS